MNTPNQAAALAVRARAGGLELCVIRKKGEERWGIPKGIIDPGDTAEDTALKESWEEAGIMGRLVRPSIGEYTYEKWSVMFTVAVYVMQVTDEHPEWPEMEWRERLWTSIDEAAALLADHPVRSLLRRIPGSVVASSYDAIAERHAGWAAGVRQAERTTFTTRLIDAFPRGASLLELGCGTAGPATRMLAEHFQLTGVDISPRSIEMARAALPAARFIAADMMSADFPVASFDAVAAFYSIIHVPRAEHARLFDRVFAWLRPGGLFVAALSGSDTADGYESDWLGAPMFWSGHDPETARQLVEAAGFAIESFTRETADENGEPVSFCWVIGRKIAPAP